MRFLLFIVLTLLANRAVAFEEGYISIPKSASGDQMFDAAIWFTIDLLDYYALSDEYTLDASLPIQVMLGGHDSINKPAYVTLYARHFRRMGNRVDFVAFPHDGHYLPTEEPAKVTDALISTVDFSTGGYK
jgi:pimeloyl-ACP methyl ester carboxylesterase